MDDKGNIEWVNEGFVKLYGYTLQELNDINGLNIKNSMHDTNAFDNVIRCINEKKPVYYENLNFSKSGKKIWAQTTITPILNDQNEITKLIAIDSDITELKKVDEELKQKNLDITDSISYASRIQQAMMPSYEKLQQHVKDSFFIFLPKDIVSGDFLWFSKIEEKLIIAVADCTGHGVPGAFMSLIGMSFLNKIVNEKGITNTDEILNSIRRNLLESLHRSISTTSADGMDISIICIEKDKNIMHFSGAMNPLYHVSGSKLGEYHGDKIPIGIYETIEKPFSKSTIKIKEGDKIYLFSDGFVDQFGGETGDKFKYQKFKELILDISSTEFIAQKEKMLHEFKTWKGDYEQIDDILILGIEI